MERMARRYGQYGLRGRYADSHVGFSMLDLGFNDPDFN